MKLPVVYVLTHDSIYVRKTTLHQPIEHTESLRLIPNMRVYRPADAEETAWAWAGSQTGRWSNVLGSNQTGTACV